MNGFFRRRTAVRVRRNALGRSHQRQGLLMSGHCLRSIAGRVLACAVAVLLSWHVSLRSQPADFRVIGIVTDPQGHVRLEHESETNSYYILYSGTTITNIVVPSDLQLGAAVSGSLNAQGLPTSGAFFQVRRVSIQEPLDIDGDGMDDVYELRRSAFLNALDPSDAARDYDGDGFANLQEALDRRDPAIYDAASTVYVVDDPAQADEFRELTEAVDYLNQSLAPDRAGRVVVLTERPQEVQTLSVTRVLRIEAGPGYYQRATVSGVGGGMVTINALEPIQLEGVRWTNTTSLVFNVGGDFRLMGNNLPGATLVNVGGAGLALAQMEPGPKRAEQGGTVNDVEIKDCSFSAFGLQLRGHVGAGTIIHTANNTGSTLTLYGDAEFSGQVKAEMQLLEGLDFRLSLAGSARLSVNQHMQLNRFKFEGRAEGTPTIELDGNVMGQADLKFLRAGHVTLTAANNDVSAGFSVEALEQADRRLRVGLSKSLIKGDLSVAAYGETTLVMSENFTVRGGALVSLEGTKADIQATKSSFGGEVSLETAAADFRLSMKMSESLFQKDVRVRVQEQTVFLLVDLSKLWCSDSRISISGPRPKHLDFRTKSSVNSRERGSGPGESSITLRDIQLNSTGDKTIQIENLEVPVTIEGGTIANSGSLANLMVNQVKGPIAVRGIQFTGGGIWVGNTESPVSIENNQFQLSGSGAASVGLNLVADNITVRSNRFNGGGDNLGVSVTAPGGTVMMANNTVKCGVGVAGTVGQMQLQDNDFTTSGALSVASGQVTATKNQFRGSIVASGDTALNLDDNELDGTLTLGAGSITARNNKIRGSVLVSGNGTLDLEGGELNGTLNLSSGRTSAKNVKFQGSIRILGDAVLGLEGNQLAGVKITDGNTNGGLKDDPVKQGALPKDVSSRVDFDNDPHHCRRLPTPAIPEPRAN
jgi:hypothetical protein